MLYIALRIDARYFGRVYLRVNHSLGLVEEVDHNTGKLVRFMGLDDDAATPCRKMKARDGYVMVSAMISDEKASFVKHRTLAIFTPNTPFIRQEIVSLISEGKLITELDKLRVGMLTFPPYQVIKMWVKELPEFGVELESARKIAARVRFEEALSIAHEYKDDPKVLKTYIDVLKRHAEIDDPDVFLVKGADTGNNQGFGNVIILTGVPEKKEENDVIEVCVEGKLEDYS